MNSSSHLTKALSNQNLIVFVTALGVGAYAVYNVGDLQTVIYAVCGAYVLRLLIQNPEVVAKMQGQLSTLQAQTVQPVVSVAATASSRSPRSLQPTHPELVPAIPLDHSHHGNAQPRLDMNMLQQTGYQPLHHQQQQTPQTAYPHDHYDPNTPTTPVPSYPHFNTSPATMRAPSRAGTQTYYGNFPNPASNPFNHTHLGVINERRGVSFNVDQTPRPSTAMDHRDSIVSTFSAFPEPTRNPYTSYSHYDAGTIGGERLVHRPQSAVEYTIPANFNVGERIAAPPQRPDSQRSNRSETLPTSSSQVTLHAPPSRSASASIETAVRISEYVPKRQHRKPTIAARVDVASAPGGGISPMTPISLGARTPSPAKSSSEPVKFFGSPVVDSPVVTSPHSGYESDSSHASSSGRSNDHRSSNNGHGRTESNASLGVPTYEKHATTIFTLVPKRPGYVPQIQAILKASRQAWLGLPGTVSHEVGQDNTTGSVVVVETYENPESMDDFEKSKERTSILERLKTFIDDSKTTVVRLPGSSAATRVVR